MDPNLETRLKVLEKKIDEMSDTLARLYRSHRAARNRKILYWVIIIGLSIVSYYSIKPYLEQLKSLYETTQNASSSYSDLLKSLN